MWIQSVNLVEAISVLLAKSHNGFATVREMMYTSQHCCDKTMVDRMALYRECCFPVSREISEFTPCLRAQSNMLQIKYAEKTCDCGLGIRV